MKIRVEDYTQDEINKALSEVDYMLSSYLHKELIRRRLDENTALIGTFPSDKWGYLPHVMVCIITTTPYVLFSSSSFLNTSSQLLILVLAVVIAPLLVLAISYLTLVVWYMSGMLIGVSKMTDEPTRVLRFGFPVGYWPLYSLFVISIIWVHMALDNNASVSPGWWLLVCVPLASTVVNGTVLLYNRYRGETPKSHLLAAIGCTVLGSIVVYLVLQFTKYI